MVVSLSTAAFDSLQSAMVSTGSNDLFHNKLILWWIKLSVVLIIVPVIIVALKSPDILQIYLISDMVSAAVVPVLVLGLWEGAYWWKGFEVVIGGLGAILTLFIFGTIYYGNAQRGASLLLLETVFMRTIGTLSVCRSLLQLQIRADIEGRSVCRRASWSSSLRHCGIHLTHFCIVDYGKDQMSPLRRF